MSDDSSMSEHQTDIDVMKAAEEHEFKEFIDAARSQNIPTQFIWGGYVFDMDETQQDLEDFLHETTNTSGGGSGGTTKCYIVATRDGTDQFFGFHDRTNPLSFEEKETLNKIGQTHNEVYNILFKTFNF